MTRRILYATAAFDEAEIDAVVGVLRGGPNALRIGKNVKEMEERVAALFGKRSGVLVSSGSAALFLAIDLINLQPGDEVITSPLTFSTDLSPLIRANAVPVFVDIEPDTFQIDVDAIEAAITDRTKALAGAKPCRQRTRLGPPPRHRRRPQPRPHRGLLRRHRSNPSRNARPARRSHISVTSFSLSHILTTAGQGGMVLLDDDELRDRCLTLRGWGRRSERQLYGSTKGDRDFWTELDGLRYDNLFIFDEPGWNFLPNEINAAFGVEQLNKLPANRLRRQANFDRYQTSWPSTRSNSLRHARPRPRHRMAVVLLPGPPGRRLHPLRPAGLPRAPRHRHAGRLDRQRSAPADDEGRQLPSPTRRLPNADQVMEFGILLPCGQALTDEDIDFVTGHLQGFLDDQR